MGRLQQVIGAVAVASGSFLGGCVHLHPAGKSEVKSPPAEERPMVPSTDPAVEQASAKVPAMVPAASMAALAKASSAEVPKGAATDIALAWQNKVAQLPDPTRNGAMIHGVVGQMFLFAADSKAAQANGSLTVEMLDQSPGAPEGKRLGKWTFEKDVLKKLVTMDERFGKSYALFLPWPEYDRGVSRVKLLVRYDSERSYPLYAPATSLTFDYGGNGTATHHRRTVSGVDVAGFGGLNTPNPSAPRPLPELDPLPVGGRNAQSLPAPTVSQLPPNLPPLVITTQR